MNGQLRLKTAVCAGKTVAEDLYFTPPFKLYSPFYQGDCARFTCMCAAAGVLGGDCNEITLHIGQNSYVHFSDQGYQKLFNTNGRISRQKVTVTVESGGRLIYLPHPVMTFGGCDHIAQTRVDIACDSTLVFSGIYCCGRTAMGEAFALRRFRSRSLLCIDGRPDFIDNTLIQPEVLPVKGTGFFEGFTHTGMLYLYSADRRLLTEAQNLCRSYSSPDEMVSACSATERGLSIRTLGFAGDPIFAFYNRIASLV